MTDRTNLVGAPLGVPGAIHAASVPPLLDTLCEHAYTWVAAHVPFETAVDLSPVTRSADRTLRQRGSVTSAELRRDEPRTGLPDGRADLVVWAAPTPPSDGLEAALAEAKRLCRPGGAIVGVLPAWAAERAADAAGLREDASVELRPLIGAAVGGGTADGEEANPSGATAAYRIVVMRRGDAPAAAEPRSGGEAAVTTLRDGARALRVELAAHSVLQGVREDERAELLERVADAERDSSEQRDRGADLVRRLDEAEQEKSDLRDEIAAAEANAEQLRTDLDLHKRWLDDIQSSLSWRLTKPLRHGKGTFGR
jgi:hypothetical protein